MPHGGPVAPHARSGSYEMTIESEGEAVESSESARAENLQELFSSLFWGHSPGTVVESSFLQCRRGMKECIAQINNCFSKTQKSLLHESASDSPKEQRMRFSSGKNVMFVHCRNEDSTTVQITS